MFEAKTVTTATKNSNPRSLIENFRRIIEKPTEIVPDREISSLIKSISKGFLQSPESMEFFYRRNHLYKKQNPHDSQLIEQLEGHLDSALEYYSSVYNPIGLNEGQLFGFFKLAEGKSLLSQPTIEVLGNKDKEFDSTLHKRSQSILKNFFEATLDPRLIKLLESNTNFSSSQIKEIEDRSFKSQIKITDLMYKLATAALASGDETLLERYLTILAFESPYLKGDDPKSLFILYGAISLDDETMAKRNRIDFLGGLLENKFLSPNEGKKLAMAGEMVVNKFENSFFMKIINSLKNKNPDRSSKLLDYVESLKPFGTETEMKDEDPFLIWTKPYEMPEDIIYRADRFMLLYFSSLSERLLENQSIKTPIQLVITDNDQIRYVATSKHDNFEAAQQVMARLLDSRETSGAVLNELFISSIMHLLRPKISEKRIEKVKDKNKLLKQRLRNPSRGLSKDGVIVKIKNDQSPDLYFSEIHYDYSGRKIRINFNGNWFDLVLDHNDFSLKYQDGGPLNLDEESMLWWENVILSPLEKLVCNGDEKDWLIAGTENLPTDKALEIKKQAIIKRIGYLRREPPGKGYTEEQRNRVLSARKFSLFGIEILDLKFLNEERGLTKQEGQYTYVFPIEQEPTGTPVEVSVPAAFDF